MSYICNVVSFIHCAFSQSDYIRKHSKHHFVLVRLTGTKQIIIGLDRVNCRIYNGILRRMKETTKPLGRFTISQMDFFKLRWRKNVSISPLPWKKGVIEFRYSWWSAFIGILPRGVNSKRPLREAHLISPLRFVVAWELTGVPLMSIGSVLAWSVFPSGTLLRWHRRTYSISTIFVQLE